METENKKTMKAAEFRVGNIINYQSGVSIYQGVVTSISSDNRICVDNKLSLKTWNWMGVPLTENEVVKLGFTHNGNENWWNLPKSNPYQSHHLMQMANGWTWFIEFDSENCRLIKGFNYVHELQNLCLVLTEQELIRQ